MDTETLEPHGGIHTHCTRAHTQYSPTETAKDRGGGRAERYSVIEREKQIKKKEIKKERESKSVSGGRGTTAQVLAIQSA